MEIKKINHQLLEIRFWLESPFARLQEKSLIQDDRKVKTGMNGTREHSGNEENPSNFPGNIELRGDRSKLTTITGKG